MLAQRDTVASVMFRMVLFTVVGVAWPSHLLCGDARSSSVARPAGMPTLHPHACLPPKPRPPMMLCPSLTRNLTHALVPPLTKATSNNRPSTRTFRCWLVKSSVVNLALEGGVSVGADC